MCMTVGLIFFTLADSQVQPEFDLIGETNVVNESPALTRFAQVCGWYAVR